MRGGGGVVNAKQKYPPDASGGYNKWGQAFKPEQPQFNLTGLRYLCTAIFTSILD